MAFFLLSSFFFMYAWTAFSRAVGSSSLFLAASNPL